jgi:hypothetical protein
MHEGHNVKRIREILGVKQDALAIQLGLSGKTTNFVPLVPFVVTPLENIFVSYL